MKRLGAPKATTEQWTRKKRKSKLKKAYDVFPANWDAVCIFLRLFGFPVRAGFTGAVTGLDHREFWRVLSAMRASRLLLYPKRSDIALYDQFLMLEHYYIGALHES